MHFVFGLRPQTEPFHLLHFIAIESCRRVLAPERIVLHCDELPYGVYWDAVRPYLTLNRVAPAAEVLAADYSRGLVPDAYRYAHHADLIRLDALIEYGGIYADIDTLFLRPLPERLFEQPFVIGREADVQDEVTGEWKRSLCNAFMMAQPGSMYARAWRAQVGEALNGSWSNHSGFLAERLSREMPDAVHLEPSRSFFPLACTPADVSRLLTANDVDLTGSFSAHLWAHVWWSPHRHDFSTVHAGTFTPEYIRQGESSLARALRPFVPDIPVW